MADAERGGVGQKDAFLSQLGSRLTDGRVLAAFGRVPHDAFVPPDVADRAFTNAVVPLRKYDVTVSQPSILGRMVEFLSPEAGDKTLEVGGGSGYAACVLAELTGGVDAVERIGNLTEETRARIAALGYATRVQVYEGDGALGLPERAPFKRILVSCGARSIPPALIEQLDEGGKIVVPVGKLPWYQDIIVGEKRNGELHEVAQNVVWFSPLMSPHPGGWTQEEIDRTEAMIEPALVGRYGNEWPQAVADYKAEKGYKSDEQAKFLLATEILLEQL